MLRQRLLGDYLQTAAIFDEDMSVLSNLTDPNDYAGPGTGYRMAPERRAEVARVRQVLVAGRSRWPSRRAPPAAWRCAELGPARARVRPDEVVIGVSPAFAVDDLDAAGRPDRRRGAAAGARRHRGGGLRGRGSCGCSAPSISA